MQKNYSLPCTGVYRPLGGVRANVAFNADSKTWACGGDPQPDGPSSPALPPQGDIMSAEPLKVCTVFLLRVSMDGAPPILVRAGCSGLGHLRTSAGVADYQDQGSHCWTCFGRGASKRCPSIPMGPGRLPERGGVWGSI